MKNGPSFLLKKPCLFPLMYTGRSLELLSHLEFYSDPMKGLFLFQSQHVTNTHVAHLLIK